MNNKEKVKVLFVCMGNICRSPTAHGVFRDIVEKNNLDGQIYVESAGTHAYHVGEMPDRRARQTALKNGVDISDLRARQVESSDFVNFDYIIAMDSSNYRDLQHICPVSYRNKLHMFLSYAPELKTNDVPDPYYGGGKGFEIVYDMVETASKGMLKEIKAKMK